MGLALALIVAAILAWPAAADVVGAAIVKDDGTLLVRQRIVRLFGIVIPRTGRTCDTGIRPARCGPRAVLALERRARGFVRCAEGGPRWGRDHACRLPGAVRGLGPRGSG